MSRDTSPPAGISLPPSDGVDFWFVLTGGPPADGDERLRLLLCESERRRHGDFVRAADARTYLLAHAMLRAALSRYLGGPPEAWSFTDDAGAKPRLRSPASVSLEFNLSHARGIAVCAFHISQPLGVDVEPLARAGRILSHAEDHFTRAEGEAWALASEEVRAERAVWTWTAKEALLKASGQGLSVDARSIRIQWRAGGGLGVDPSSEGLQGSWILRRLRFGHDFLGAIAVPQAAPAMRWRAFAWEVNGAAPRILDSPCLESDRGLVEISVVRAG